MLSDWHVGAGFGRPENVDRLLLRDADDLPFLPAKTIRGMWRDAAERLATALGPGWGAIVDVVFGDQPAQNRAAEMNRPRETALVVTPARLPVRLREKVKTSPALRQAVAFVKPGVMIDPASGRAKDDFLRFEEVARAGAVLTATATFDPVRAGPAADAAEKLALAATRLLTRIGGKRRRGNGRCALTVTNADVDAAITWLEANPTAPPCRRSRRHRPSPPAGGPRSATAGCPSRSRSRSAARSRRPPGRSGTSSSLSISSPALTSSRISRGHSPRSARPSPAARWWSPTPPATWAGRQVCRCRSPSTPRKGKGSPTAAC
ncbi:MAG TPA: RAMP superfamily CRISPR-associated protein [Urbifossiella sp.]|nr:RAMP superfamily CRISPR-associated protein [Urbifossiella sp.]